MRDTTIPVDDGRLAATVSGDRARLVLLHPGVGDRRSWFEVMGRLGTEPPSVAYDRRGFGESPPAEAPFDNVADLGAVLDATVDGCAVLVGNSQGGLVAIDFALAHPDRVERLILVAPAVSGAPDVDWDAELGADLVAAIEAAEEAGDREAVNRHEALVWLDGPAGPEGRVGGAARDLFLAMNRIALEHESAPGPIDHPPAWDRLDELGMPVLVIVGSRDLAAVKARARVIADRVPQGQLVEIDGVAHLPQLERPDDLARLVCG